MFMCVCVELTVPMPSQFCERKAISVIVLVIMAEPSNPLKAALFCSFPVCWELYLLTLDWQL